MSHRFWLRAQQIALAAPLVVLVLALGVQAAQSDLQLVAAAKGNNWDAVRTLLKQRSGLPAMIKAVDADGTTALHWAVRADNTEIAQALLRAGASAKAADRYGITPLTLAAETGNAVILEALLKAGADANTAQLQGETTLMTAARTGKPEALKVLLAHGANPNARENRFGETAAMWAAAENNGEAVKVLAAAGADLNAMSNVLSFPQFRFLTSGMVTTALPKGGWTPLMYAAREGAIEGARALLDAGANPNLADPEGSTAMILATINAHFDLAAMMADKGADPNVPDVAGMTALYAAVDMHTLPAMLSRPAPKVLDEMDSVSLVTALLKRGANPNLRLKRPIIGRHHGGGDASMAEGTTPLMRALKVMDVPVVRALLDGGADATIPQKDYSTTVMLALGAANVPDATMIQVLDMLVAKGVDLNGFNVNGQTAVHLVVQRGADPLVRYLAERGANLTMKNKAGSTPLDIALGIVPAAPAGAAAAGGRGGARGAAAAAPAGRGGRGGGGAPVVRESTAAILREFMNK